MLFSFVFLFNFRPDIVSPCPCPSAPMTLGKTKTDRGDALVKNGVKRVKRGSEVTHFTERLAVSDFSRAQIVVNDCQLPLGFEIRSVGGSFFPPTLKMDSFHKAP